MTDRDRLVELIEKAQGDCYIRAMNSENKQFIGVEYNDFCSYGERRSTNDKS